MTDAYLDSVADPVVAAKTLDANQPIGRIGRPADIANLALWLASDESVHNRAVDGVRWWLDREGVTALIENSKSPPTSATG